MNGSPISWRTLHGVTLRDAFWLGIPLWLAAIPLIPDVGLLPMALFALCVLVFMAVAAWGRALPGWTRWATLLIGLGVVYQTHRAFSGMEPGMALLVALLATKLVELRTRREYRMMCILGYFVVLCGVFFSQEFALCVYELLVFFLFTLTLRRFHSGREETGAAPSAGDRMAEGRALVRASGVALLQALPVVLILYAFFPRVNGFGLQLLRRNVTGMSDHLSPGEVEKLVEDGSPAFRARFTRGNPGSGPFYWRGLVLWEASGLEWFRGRLRNEPALFIRESSVRRPVEQEIIVEPHGGRWLFALDQPLYPPQGEQLLEGRYLYSQRPIDYRKLYHVVSGPVTGPLDPSLRAAALSTDPPEKIPRRVRDLAASWVGEPKEKVRTAIRYFSRNFRYTLAAGSYATKDGWQMLDTFLFERKEGFCSHYAAAFASLMRLSGIPARVVMGYYGGAYNPVGDFYEVSQADAHAWCEVWLEKDGWVRVDPTAFVPGGRRMSRTAEQASDPAADVLEPQRAPGQALETPGFFQQMLYQWATFNYRWTVWVLGYDREVQQEFFSRLGLARLSRGVVFLWAVAGALAFFVALRYYLQWRSRPRVDELTRAYQHLCARLSAAGLARNPSEPPAAYRDRVFAARPDLRPLLGSLFEQYIHLRYAPWKLGDPAAVSRLLIRRMLLLNIPPTAPAPSEGQEASTGKE